MSRAIFMKISLPTNEYVLQQSVTHGRLYGRVLSAAKVARALLTACAVANAPLGQLESEEVLTAWIAEAFKHHAKETRA